MALISFVLNRTRETTANGSSLHLSYVTSVSWYLECKERSYKVECFYKVTGYVRYGFLRSVSRMSIDCI